MKTLKSIILFFFFPLNTILAQTIVTIAGNGVKTYNGEGLLATNAQMGANAMFVDNSDIVYIADANNHRIRRININGTVSTIAGTGEYGYTGNGGPATAAKIRSCADVHVDSYGNVYFTEWINCTVRKVSPSGIISLVAGTGSGGYNGDNIPATNAQLAAPSGITTDASGNIYFADLGNHCVRKVNTLGIITTIAGTPTLLGYSGDGGQATAAKLNYPGFLSWGVDNSLYWTEWPNKIVRKLDIVSGIIGTVAGNGLDGNSGDGGQATDAKLSQPNGVAVDTGGNIYIADTYNHNIRKVNSSGIISTIAGVSSIMGYSGDGGHATTAQFNTPNCVIFDKWGNLYINDAKNFRIRRVNYNPILGVSDISSNEIKAIIYPNPASNEITISSNQLIKEIAIINLLGQTVINKTTNNKEIPIDVSQLPAGIYIAKADGMYAGQFAKE